MYRRKSDGRWVATVTLPGGARRVAYAGDREEARRLLAALIYERDQGRLQPRDTGTVRELAEGWLERKQRVLRPKSVTFYEQLLRVHILPRLGNRQVQKVTPQHVRSFLDLVAEKGLSPKSQRHVATLLRAILEDAVEVEVIARNPARSVRVIAPRGERRTDAWSPAEVARFLEVARCDPRPANVKHSGREPGRQDPLYAAFYLALTCGLRRGEVLGLRWQDVDLAAGTITIAQAIVDVNGQAVVSRPKTRNAQRTIHIAADLVQVLREHQARQEVNRQLAAEAWEGTGLVFTTGLGGLVHPRNLARSFKRLIDAANEDAESRDPKGASIPRLRRIRVHDTRHTYASLALRGGAKVEAISERLGHYDPSVTMAIYRHLLDGERKEAALSLRDLLAGPGVRGQA